MIKEDKYQPLWLKSLFHCSVMIHRLGFLFILVLRAKNEKGAGFRQRNSFLLQLQVSHWSGPRTDGNFRLYLLIISYSLGEMSS